MNVDVRWHSVEVSTATALESHVRDWTGATEVTSGRICPRCGATGHGRPWMRADVRLEVSLSRCGPYLVTALSRAGRIGVDVEQVSRVAASWDPALVEDPDEHAGTDLDRARTWVRKEAVLKAYGVGLSRPMSDLRLADFPGVLSDLPAPAGWVAALARLPR